jgi:hypothetical protein
MFLGRLAKTFFFNRPGGFFWGGWLLEFLGVIGFYFCLLKSIFADIWTFSILNSKKLKQESIIICGCLYKT